MTIECRRTNGPKGLLIFSAALFYSQLSLGSDLQSLIDDPDAARAFEYCAWAHGTEEYSEKMPDVEAIMNDKTGEVTEKMVASAVLVEAGIKVSRAAKTRKLCDLELNKGAALFNRVLAKHTRMYRKSGGFNSSDKPEIFTVQNELSRLWIQDQAARVTYIDLQTKHVDGAAHWARRLSVANAKLADSEAAELMKKILGSFDWIDKDRFGARSSRQAWLLIQHADDHSDLQKLALDRMEPYLRSGGVLPRDYAYLWDRVAVNTGQLQRYGTQPTWECSEGNLTLYAMEDPENVDDRRAKMGMGPAANDLAEMARNTCK